MGLYNYTIHQLQELIAGKEVTAKELLDSFLENIENVEEEVKAYITITEGEARSRIEQGLQGKLAGIPIAVKDNISTEGIKTTCASRILEDYVPPFDATVIRRLKEEGAVIIGKNNLDEFAMGSSTENSAFFPTRNPRNTDYVPGGSSGGSAAAVAAGEAAGALGSDTGGSVRQPASFCGIVGLKPTYGSISRYGLAAFASSLDQIGIFSRDVEDTAILLNVLTGYDPLDSTSAKLQHPDYTDFLKDELEGMKIALPEEYFSVDMDPEVRECVITAVRKLEEAGAEIEEVRLSGLKYALAAYYIISSAEASSNLARYDGVRYGYRFSNARGINEMYEKSRKEFGDEVKRRILFGTYVLSSGKYEDYYLKAQKARKQLTEEIQNLFREYHLLVSPATPTTAFKLGAVKDPFEMDQTGIFTVAANLSGIPAISIPCGVDSRNLPVGIQIMGPHFQEGRLIQAAYSLEIILGFKHPGYCGRYCHEQKL